MTVTDKLRAGSNPAAGTTATAANAGVNSLTMTGGSTAAFTADGQFPGTVLTMTPVAGQTNTLRDEFDSGVMADTLAWTGYVYVPSTPSARQAFFGPRTAASGTFGAVNSGGTWTSASAPIRLFAEPDGQITLLDTAAAYTQVAASGKIPFGNWYIVQTFTRGNQASAGEFKVRFFNVTDTALASPLELITTVNLTNNPYHATKFEYARVNLAIPNKLYGWDAAGAGASSGSGVSKLVNVRYDDGASTYVAPYVAANSAPAVNAGGNQIAAPGSLVQLAGSATDADGDPLSWSWTWIYSSTGSNPALTGATTPSPSFTATSQTNGHRYGLRASVTDGKVTVVQDVWVNVPSEDASVGTLPGDGTNNAWVKKGSAATIGDGLNDVDNTTGMTSPTLTTTETVNWVPLRPMRTRTGLKILLDHGSGGASISGVSVVGRFGVLVGGVGTVTQKAEWPLTPNATVVVDPTGYDIPTANLPANADEWAWGYIAIAPKTA